MKYLLCIAFLSAASLHAQVDFGQMSPNELAQYWLTNDCGVTDDGPAINQFLVAQVEAVEPLLIRAYQDGPGVDQIRQLEEQARMNFSVIQKALESGNDYGLSKEDLELARQQTVDEYVKAEREKFILGYRSQALLGLAAGGGEAGKKLLSEIASQEEQSTLSRTARYGLEKME